jgi:hypothetical protein
VLVLVRVEMYRGRDVDAEALEREETGLAVEVNDRKVMCMWLLETKL